MPDIQLITSQDALLNGHQHHPRLKPAKTWNIRVSPSVASRFLHTIQTVVTADDYPPFTQTISRNPIRSTLASVTSAPPSTTKTLINLGLGDPTHYPLHPPPPASITATREALDGQRHNGYVPGVGTSAARKAVADYHQRWDNVQYHEDSIVLTHGVGQALDLIFSVLFPPSHFERTNILLPRPVFAQYPTLLSNLGVEVRFYDCIEANNWEADLTAIERMCDEGTRAIMVTNPSNPCGTNFSASHLRAILAIADRHKVPIIADEIYGHITWSGPFIPLASLSDAVPIITLSGLSKRFLLPGWRFGWIALHDPLHVADSVKEGMAVWANRFFGPSSVAQAALPAILETPAEWHNEVLAKIKLNAEIMFEAINRIPGLSCTPPAGALYMLVRIDSDTFPTSHGDVDFCTALYREEAVFVLPGECFEASGYFRIVLASPADVMSEVGVRLAEFCNRHRRA